MDKIDDERIKAEQLKAKPEIKRELEKAQDNEPKAPPAVAHRPILQLIVYAAIILAFIALYYVLRYIDLGVPDNYTAGGERWALGAAAIVLILGLLRAARSYLIDKIDGSAARYNLTRIVKLLAGLAVFFVALSIVFENWYTAVLSLGVISLILGFALQTPITSFIGWIYVLIKVPYKVGDRIKIGDATGDVLDVAYLDTTLWEFGGDLLSSANHPSGRIIKFPNSKVLSSVVYNYSWPLFPYVWNDIKFQIAYQSDLDFVTEVMMQAAAEEVGEAMMEHVRVYRELLSQTSIDQLEVKEHPAVIFRISENTWVEAIIRYLVEPKQAGSVKTRLIRKILAGLNAEPAKVMFPKGDNR